MEWCRYPYSFQMWVFTKTERNHWTNDPPRWNVLEDNEENQITLIHFVEGCPFPYSEAVLWPPAWLPHTDIWIDIIPNNYEGINISAPLPIETPIPIKTPTIIPFTGIHLFKKLSNLPQEKIKLVLKCH